MKQFKYRENNYFNDTDYYAFEDNSLKKTFVSKVHFYKGNWYTNESLNYKATSIRCFNLEINNHYKPPFTRTFSKVSTDDYGMAFDFPLSMIYENCINLESETKDKIIDVLNGTQEGKLDANLFYRDGIIYHKSEENEHEFMIIRGWGRLTGKGGKSLDSDHVALIQDAFGMSVIEKLT